MATIAIIGGTGLSRLDSLTVHRREMVKTPYGVPSCPLVYGELNGVSVVFLSRHGNRQSIPAHLINYCANVWALHSVGVNRILAVGVVGAIDDACKVGDIVIPDQIIDYTSERAGSYERGDVEGFHQIDFSYPFNDALRQELIQGGSRAAVSLVDHGTYGTVSGPRLETVAEVRRMEQDGCSIVGMSCMPEAALARELALDYAFCAVTVNPAAGKGDGVINVPDWQSAINTGMASAQLVLTETVSLPMPDLEKRLESAKRIAEAAAQTALQHFTDHDSLRIERKGAQDWVSNADRDVELQIRTALNEQFPDDSIIGEEHDNQNGSSPYTWVIDPIDGTTSFVNAMPGWCVVIACVIRTETVIGVIVDPIARETYCACKGGVSRMNDKPIRVSMYWKAVFFIVLVPAL